MSATNEATTARNLLRIRTPLTVCIYIRSEALRKVKVPMDVIDLLTDLRAYLQEKCEPPVYVSDRRLVKALQLLQVN